VYNLGGQDPLGEVVTDDYVVIKAGSSLGFLGFSKGKASSVCPSFSLLNPYDRSGIPGVNGLFTPAKRKVRQNTYMYT
jgi:hypothetical protein